MYVRKEKCGRQLLYLAGAMLSQDVLLHVSYRCDQCVMNVNHKDELGSLVDANSRVVFVAVYVSFVK